MGHCGGRLFDPGVGDRPVGQTQRALRVQADIRPAAPSRYATSPSASCRSFPPGQRDDDRRLVGGGQVQPRDRALVLRHGDRSGPQVDRQFDRGVQGCSVSARAGPARSAAGCSSSPQNSRLGADPMSASEKVVESVVVARVGRRAPRRRRAHDQKSNHTGQCNNSAHILRYITEQYAFLIARQAPLTESPCSTPIDQGAAHSARLFGYPEFQPIWGAASVVCARPRWPGHGASLRGQGIAGNKGATLP